MPYDGYFQMTSHRPTPDGGRATYDLHSGSNGPTFKYSPARTTYAQGKQVTRFFAAVGANNVPPELVLALDGGGTLRLTARTGGFTVQVTSAMGSQTVSFGRLEAWGMILTLILSGLSLPRDSDDLAAEARQIPFLRDLLDAPEPVPA